MTTIRIALAALMLLGVLYARPAVAAEGRDNCSGYIDQLPVVISASGTWCLRKQVQTSYTVGRMLNITANNVTIDCNHHAILGNGNPADETIGVAAQNLSNVTVRNCTIAGFEWGVYLTGSGHRVEDNLIRGNFRYGMVVYGFGNSVERNRVLATGGTPREHSAIAIDAEGDVMDNLVEGVRSDNALAPHGIVVRGNGTQATGNRVSGLTYEGSALAMGIGAAGMDQTIAGNFVVDATGTLKGWGVYGKATGFCTRNQVSGFTTRVGNCQHEMGNLSHAVPSLR